MKTIFPGSTAAEAAGLLSRAPVLSSMFARQTGQLHTHFYLQSVQLQGAVGDEFEDIAAAA